MAGRHRLDPLTGLLQIRSITNLLSRHLRPHFHYFDDDRDRVSKQLFSMSVQREPQE